MYSPSKHPIIAISNSGIQNDRRIGKMVNILFDDVYFNDYPT